METLVQPTPEKPVELQFLTGWERDPARTGRAGFVSALLHIAAIVALILVPRTLSTPPPREAPLVTPLIEPLTELTQKAPNTGKLAKEVSAPAVQPRPRMQTPATPPPAPHAAPRSSSPPPSPPPMPEPPHVDTAHALPAGPQTAHAVPPPPQIQPEEKPKLQFEAPTAPPPVVGHASIPIPDTSVNGAIQRLSRGESESGLTVGDMGDAPGGIGEALNLPPSPGRSASALQLLSDPLGVDFRPYLTQVLSSVRRNWFAVWPESAKMGRRGKVEIQFAISREGGVPKLVIILPSGAEALDRAAVAGISASNPFPPLPTAYTGGTIRLQLTFQYNVPRH